MVNASTASHSKTSKRPKKSAGNPTAIKTHFASMPAGFLCTLIPEPFTLNSETGAKGEVSRYRGIKEQDTGFDVSPSPKIHPSPFLIRGCCLFDRTVGSFCDRSKFFANQTHEFWSVAQNQKICLRSSCSKKACLIRTKTPSPYECEGAAFFASPSSRLIKNMNSDQ